MQIIMNVQIKEAKPPPVHGITEIIEDKGIAVTVCGHWLNWDNYKTTQREITCGLCLKILAQYPDRAIRDRRLR